MSNQSLEQEIMRLEDIEAIAKLTATYALYVNKGWNGEAVDFDKLPSVFARNAQWKCAAISVDVSGVDSIIEMLREKTKAGDFAMHSFTNPIIRGSFVGNREDMAEALDFAAWGKVKADVELRPLSDINNVFTRLEHGDVPARVVI